MHRATWKNLDELGRTWKELKKQLFKYVLRSDNGPSKFFQVRPSCSVEFCQTKNIQKCSKISSKIIEIGDPSLMILDEILNIFYLEKYAERPGRTWTNLEGLGRS